MHYKFNAFKRYYRISVYSDTMVMADTETCRNVEGYFKNF
jgi:hypothetical protein